MAKDPYVVAVGARLRATVREFGLTTAQQLASELGAERSAVSNWYTGVALPPVPYMVKLCDRYHLTLDWVYRGKADGIPVATWIRISSALDGDAVPELAPEPAPAGERQAARPRAGRSRAAGQASSRAAERKADNG